MFKLKEYVLFSLLGLVLVGAIFIVLFLDGGLTGKVILESTSTYVEGENLKGDLKIFLKQGELIPDSSRIIFENANQTQEYNLKDVVSEETVSGNFYLQQSGVLGTGNGFGIKGEKVSYPKLYFELKILSGFSKEKVPRDEKGTENDSDTPEENTTKTKLNESSDLTDEEIPETGNETIEVEEAEVEIPEEVIEEIDESGEVEEEPEDTSVIPTITGGVTLAFEKEISGEFFSDEKFVYNLNPGQKAELVPGSLRTDSENLNDDKINLVIKGNKVIVTSDYMEIEEGFGKEYLGEEIKILSINFSNFNFKPEKGDLKITIIYKDEEIVSVDTVLEEGVTKKTSGGFLDDLDFLNDSKKKEIEEYVVLLTEDESQRLSNKFGNQSVEITKAEKTSQGFLFRFELEIYWVEHYYSLEMSEEKLKLEVEEDKIRFLKDLANKILEEKEETEREVLVEFIG